MKNENNDIKERLLLLGTICFYASSLVLFIINSNGIAVSMLCLGSCFLCLFAASINNKNKK